MLGNRSLSSKDNKNNNNNNAGCNRKDKNSKIGLCKEAIGGQSRHSNCQAGEMSGTRMLMLHNKKEHNPR